MMSDNKKCGRMRRFAYYALKREKEENNVQQVKRRWKREYNNNNRRAVRIASEGSFLLLCIAVTSFTVCSLYYRMELIAISWFARFESLFCPHLLRRRQARERMLILHTMMPAEW